jgi:hypothetical protein
MRELSAMTNINSVKRNPSLSNSLSIFAGFVISAVVLIAYQPALSIGFWTDDFSFIDLAGRLPFGNYIAFYFDPLNQSHWYRPAQGMAWWLSYMILRGDSTGYHLNQLLIHIANSLLLFALVSRVTRRTRLAFLAALVYVTLPVYALAVYWPGVADPLASLFYLLTLWFWIDYLLRGGALRYSLSVLAFVLALLSKELNSTLLIALLLADFWLIGKPTRFSDLLKRYAAFLLVMPAYALAVFTVLTQSVFTLQLGYGVSSSIGDSIIRHLSVLAFPWGLEPPWSYPLLAAILALLVYAIARRAKRVLFVAAAALLAVLPVLPFPAALAQSPRYLYLPLMASGIGFAWLIETAVHLLATRAGRWIRWVGALALVLLVLWSSASIAEGAVNFAGTARVARLQLRQIYEQHPSFPPDTFLYFINPPFDTPYINGMMLLRYGPGVMAYGTDRDHIAPLRERNVSIIYFMDDQQNWHGQMIDKGAVAPASPRPPIHFDQSIALVDFEVANPRVKQGDSIFMILYWQNAQKIDKDYTVFVHLVDEQDQMLTGIDGPPRQNTSSWRTNDLRPDGIVMPIDASVPPGEYRIELGLYDAATMQRLSVLDANGQPISDKVVIAPITVEDQVAR